MRVRIAQRNQIEGWGFSLILHGILLSAIVPSFRLLPASIRPEPFRWNVMFAESPQQTTPVEPDSGASFAKKFTRSTETEIHSSVSPPMDVPRPPQLAKSDNYRIVEESNEARPVMAAPPPTLMVQPRPWISPQMPSTTETTSVTQETLPLPRDTAKQPKTIIATTPIPTELSAPLVTRIEQEFPSTPAPSVENAAMTVAQPRDTSPVPALPASSQAASGQSSTPQADYSWLQRAVSRRLEELKRSSRPSLEDSSRLKVLVRAVVSDTGELMEAEVVKSSGLERIDREAMTLVQRAFPMPFDQALDRPQIVMRIPITYSRD